MRREVRAGDLLGLPVLDAATGRRLGVVQDLALSGAGERVRALVLAPPAWWQAPRLVPWEQVRAAGSAAVLAAPAPERRPAPGGADAAGDGAAGAAADAAGDAAGHAARAAAGDAAGNAAGHAARTAAGHAARAAAGDAARAAAGDAAAGPRWRELAGKPVLTDGGDELGLLSDLRVRADGVVTGYQLSCGLLEDLLEGQPVVPGPLGLRPGPVAIVVPAVVISGGGERV